MNASLIFMLILVIGFSVVQVPYGYSLNSSSSSSSSTYYEKNCRNDTCVVTTCNNGQSCHTGLSENSTANTTQSQLTDKGSFEKENGIQGFLGNFLNFDK